MTVTFTSWRTMEPVNVGPADEGTFEKVATQDAENRGIVHRLSRVGTFKLDGTKFMIASGEWGGQYTLENES